MLVFDDTTTTVIYTLFLPDALPIWQIVERFDHVDALINNAGLAADGLLRMFALKAIHDLVDVKVGGTLYVTPCELDTEVAEGAEEVVTEPAWMFFLVGVISSVALDAGYGIGGRTKINGVEKDTRISTFRFGVTFALPVAKRHTLKLSGFTGVRVERGPDFNAVVLSYQYRWGI